MAVCRTRTERLADIMRRCMGRVMVITNDHQKVFGRGDCTNAVTVKTGFTQRLRGSYSIAVWPCPICDAHLIKDDQHADYELG